MGDLTEVYAEELLEMLTFLQEVATRDRREWYGLDWWMGGMPHNINLAAEETGYWLEELPRVWEYTLREMAELRMLAMLIKANKKFSNFEILDRFDESLYIHYIRLAIELMEDDFWEEIEGVTYELEPDDRRKIWRTNAN
jgi:hypothetical protein